MFAAATTAMLCGVAGVLSLSSPAAASATPARTTVRFVPIVEPFDPGHPARAVKNPGNCKQKQTTVGIEFCFEAKTENTDARIDAAQLARFNRSSAAKRAGINAQDRAWLSARIRVCQAAYHSGGTIDGINVASCLLDESTARLYGVTGKTAPRATLSQTDSQNLGQLSWFTTAGGTRIATIDTQGDETGGEVLAWVIIGGYAGFTVNPAQFFYKDGSFTDPGKIEPPNPRWHHVKAGHVYQFTIDYSRISHDPHRGGGFVYAPGGRVLADWAGR